MLGFIETLDEPENVGVNPEFAHETMAGLNFVHHVAQAIDAGKLFHIDLNGQKPGRYDQDLRFGQEDQKTNFFLVKLLEDSGYAGMRHFDAHALRSSNPDDVWEFAKGCMRTYLDSQGKSRTLQSGHGNSGHRAGIERRRRGFFCRGYSSEVAKKLKGTKFNVEALTNRALPYEKLDQLVVELLLGIR